MEKKIIYFYENGKHCVGEYGFSKHPKFYFFDKEFDAKDWTEVLKSRHNFKGNELWKT